MKKSESFYGSDCFCFLNLLWVLFIYLFILAKNRI